MLGSLQAASRRGAAKWLLALAMGLSILLNLVGMVNYLRGSAGGVGWHRNVTRASILRDDADEATVKLLAAEQRAELLLAQLRAATTATAANGTGAANGTAAALVTVEGALISTTDEFGINLQQRSEAAAASPASGGLGWLLWLGWCALLELLRYLLLLGPGLLGVALALAGYLKVTRRIDRQLKRAVVGSALLLALADLLGLPGGGAALSLYAGAAVVTLGVGLWLSEGWRRALTFWRLVGVMIVHYKAVRAWGGQADIEKADLELAYDELHKRYAPRVLQLILELRGFYVKLGQVLSVMDIVPEVYRQQLQQLQAGVPPKPPYQVHAIISESLGKPISHVFSWLDDNPLGSASIGQVHRARLLDGREVVVKVQYPEVRRLFDSDFTQLVGACYFWTPQAMGEMAEFRKQFMAEFDFRREAKVMEQIRRNLARPFPKVCVPKLVDPDMVSENVLVMTELAGGSLLDGLKRTAQAYAEAQGISVDQLKQQMMEDGRTRESQGEALGDGGASAGPSRLKLALLQGYMRTSTLAVNTGVALYNGSIGRVAKESRKKYQQPLPMINIEATVRTLCAVLGHQVLRDGLFSSDPHPGNVMLLHDGRIGLIDFGQAKYLTKQQRLLVARTVVAVASGDEPAMLRIARESKFRTKHNDASSLVRYTRFVWEGSLRELAKLAKVDPVEQTDGELVMVRRAVVLTRSVGAVMGCPVNMAKEWEPIARQLLHDEGVDAGAGGGGEPAEAGVAAGGGVRVALLTGKDAKGDAKIDAVKLYLHLPPLLHPPPSPPPADGAASSSDAAAAANGADGAAGVAAGAGAGAGAVVCLHWEDEYTAFMWPNAKVRGNTLGPLVGSYGEAGLVRLLGGAARAARGMRAERGFSLEATPTEEGDDRLQLVRALCYIGWGHASKSITKQTCKGNEAGGAPYYYAIAAGLKTIRLAGAYAELHRDMAKSSTIEKEVRKYFPRRFFERMHRESPVEMAPQFNSMCDLVATVLGPPPDDDPHGARASDELLALLFGDSLELAAPSGGGGGGGGGGGDAPDAPGGGGATPPAPSTDAAADGAAGGVAGASSSSAPLASPPSLPEPPATRRRPSSTTERERLWAMLREDDGSHALPGGAAAEAATVDDVAPAAVAAAATPPVLAAPSLQSLQLGRRTPDRLRPIGGSSGAGGGGGESWHSERRSSQGSSGAARAERRPSSRQSAERRDSDHGEGLASPSVASTDVEDFASADELEDDPDEDDLT